MREHLYRVRWRDTGKIIEDFMSEYTCDDLNSECFIVEQYTGLKDKNGVKVFEGDTIGKKGGAVHAIIYSESDAKYISKFPPFDNELTGHCGLNQLWIDECQKEIIGNIRSEAKG